MAEGPGANDELYPIAVLIDELKVRHGNEGTPALSPFDPFALQPPASAMKNLVARTGS